MDQVVIYFVFFLTCGITYLWIRGFINYSHLKKNGIEIKGVITKTTFYFRNPRVNVSYNIDNVEYEEKPIEFLYNTLYENGKSVSIKYDRSNPNKIFIVGDKSFLYSNLFVVLYYLFILGTIIYMSLFNK